MSKNMAIKATSARKRHPKWTELIEKIESSGLKNSFICSKLNLTQQYIYQILHGFRPMPDYVKDRFENLLNCTLERPSPEPEKEAT